jgi:hypothetical protein
MEESKFLQNSCSIYINEISVRLFVLVEHRGDQVLSVMYVELPNVINFWDEVFKYYPYLWN